MKISRRVALAPAAAFAALPFAKVEAAAPEVGTQATGFIAKNGTDYDWRPLSYSELL
jgi:hypothetical protein